MAMRVLALTIVLITVTVLGSCQSSIPTSRIDGLVDEVRSLNVRLAELENEFQTLSEERTMMRELDVQRNIEGNIDEGMRLDEIERR